MENKNNKALKVLKEMRVAISSEQAKMNQGYYRILSYIDEKEQQLLKEDKAKPEALTEENKEEENE